MNVTIKLLDTLKGARNLASDYAAAKALSVGTSLTTSWRKGKVEMSDETAVKLADLAGLDPFEVLAELRIERATKDGNEAERLHWEQWRDDFRMLKVFNNTRIQAMLNDPESRKEVEKAIEEVAHETGADAEKMKRSPLLKPIFACAMLVMMALPIGLTTAAAGMSNSDPNYILCYPKRRKKAQLVA